LTGTAGARGAAGAAARARGSVHGLLLLACVALIVGCAGIGLDSFDEPEVELLALEPLPARGMEARFLLRLRIVNPNPLKLDIDGLAYEVFLRDSKVLSGASNERVVVDAYSEGEAALEVAAGVLGSLSLLRDLMSHPTADAIPYRLKAKISRRGIGGALRVSREGTLDLSQGLRRST
jgi:LEA14-like dessication related protein